MNNTLKACEGTKYIEMLSLMFDQYLKTINEETFSMELESICLLF